MNDARAIRWLGAMTVAVMGMVTMKAAAAEDVLGWAQTVWGPGGRTVVQAPAAAFALEEGEVWHPAAALDVALTTFDGVIEMPDVDRYRFRVDVEGGAVSIVVRGGAAPYESRLVAADELATAYVPLPDGDVRLTLRFHRRGSGPARMRTRWERSEDVGRFPVSPLLGHEVRVPDEFVDDVRASSSVATGRALLESKGCVSCHAPAAGEVWSALSHDGFGEHALSMSAWIADGTSLHGSLGMTIPLSRDERTALATFLAHGPVPARVDEGRALFDSVGCVACHGPFESIGASPPGARHPLTPSATWTGGRLLNALVDPEQHLPLDITVDEADALGAALAGRGGFDVMGDAEAGARLFIEVGCAACHTALDGSTQRPDVTALADLTGSGGCLAGNAGNAPQFTLTADEHAALGAALAVSATWSPHVSPADTLQRALHRHDCLSCHVRDGRGGPPAEWRAAFTTVDEDVDLGDEGRLPPDLSDIGSRMTTHALRRVLVEGHRARPWMSTRMPLYGESAEGLAELFTRSAGLWPDAPEAWPGVDDEAVLAGRELVGTEGMNCISCHLFGDRDPAGTPGLHLDGMAERMRYEWFTNWMSDPQRMRPGTRMPAFGEAGHSSIESLYDGDFGRQVDALWAYLSLGEFAPVPAGLEAPAGVVLDVGELPRVVRTFLDDAGSRGIAVGYPVGVHVAYDAGSARFVSAWEGAFLDASGAWAARGGNVSGGRGPLLWEADDGPPIVVTSSDVAPDDDVLDAWTSARRFAGYRLDDDGVPTFYTRADGGVRLGERLVPDVGARRLRHTWVFPDSLADTQRVWLRTADGWEPIEPERARAGITTEIDW